MKYRQILKAVIPYVDGEGAKTRPVVQLSAPSGEHKNMQVAYITSRKPPGSFATDIEINTQHSDFAKTGLTHTSYIRVSKIFTVSASSVELVLGDLPTDITTKLNQILLTHLKLNNLN